MRNILVTAALLLAAFGVSAVASAKEGSARCPGTARVPMIKWDHVRPAAYVDVNGRGPFLFLIDTGASGNARADTRLVEQLGLKPAGTAERNDGSKVALAQQSRMSSYTLNSVRLGGLTRRHVEAPSRSYNQSTKHRPIDGILGYGFFAGCLLTLDYSRGQIIVGPGRLATGPTVLRYQSDDGGPLIPVLLDGRHVVANIDSGDNSGFTLPASLLPGLRFRDGFRTIGSGQSANNQFDVREASVRGKIQIGAAVWYDPTVTTVQAFENFNVGSAALQNTAVTFDLQRKLVRIRSARDERQGHNPISGRSGHRGKGR